MDEAKQQGRQLSLQEPAIEVKRNECSAQGSWAGGPPTSRFQHRGRRPVSRTRSDPALSNGAAGLQDTEMGIGRNSGGQFETSFNLTTQL
jgi:hypothetical protein